MKKFLSKVLMIPAIVLALSPIAMQTAYAGGFSNSKSSACAGINALGAGQNCGSNGSAVNTLIRTGVTILAWVVGIIAIIMILVSGLKFMTSGGESSKIAEAKTSLMWALAGVAIVALAEALVHWVFNTAQNAASQAGIIVIQRIVDFL